MDALSNCYCVGATSTRNGISVLLAAILFFLGWWFIIDASTEHGGGVNFSHHICGILATISFIMVNSVDTNPDGYSGYSENRVRAWLFVGFVLGFSSIIAATWIMIAEFTIIDDMTSKWPGVALMLQNMFIFASSLIYKFGRSGDIPYGY